MKKIVLIYCMLFCVGDTSLFSQVNLVPNPSFEIITNCNPLPTGGFNLGMIPPWDSPSDGSPDPYDTCSTPFSSSGVPNNGYGYQQPHSGGAYAGVGLYSETDGFREYLQVQLNTALVANQTYCASFYISLRDSCKIGCNNFGIYFSNIHTYVSTINNLNIIPQINYSSIVIDAANWVLISGQYTAVGGENYIIIGNFYSNSSTQVNIFSTNGAAWMHQQAYYFIDDVSVIDCTGQGINEFQVSSPKFQIIPNPNNGEFSINLNKEYKNAKIEITDVLGQCIYQQLTTNNQQLTIDIESFAKGVYFVSITADENKQVVKLIKQ